MKGDNRYMWLMNSNFKDKLLSSDMLVKSISSMHMTIPGRDDRIHYDYRINLMEKKYLPERWLVQFPNLSVNLTDLGKVQDNIEVILEQCSNDIKLNSNFHKQCSKCEFGLLQDPYSYIFSNVLAIDHSIADIYEMTIDYSFKEIFLFSTSYLEELNYRIIELLIDTENSKIYLACHY